MLVAKLFFNDHLLEDALVLMESKTIQEFLTSYVQLNNLAADDLSRQFELYHIQSDGSLRYLAENQTFGQLGLPTATRLELRVRGAKAADKAPRRPAPPGPPEPLPAAPAGNRLRCDIEVVKGKLVPVPLSGITINRPFIEQHLSVVGRTRMQAMRLVGKTPPLMFVSRSRHCDIHLNAAGTYWEINAYRALTINGRVYDQGSLFQLPPHTTLVRLGREGVAITIHLNFE